MLAPDAAIIAHNALICMKRNLIQPENVGPSRRARTHGWVAFAWRVAAFSSWAQGAVLAGRLPSHHVTLTGRSSVQVTAGWTAAESVGVGLSGSESAGDRPA
jgi:hypothetical protein